MSRPLPARDQDRAAEQGQGTHDDVERDFLEIPEEDKAEKEREERGGIEQRYHDGHLAEVQRDEHQELRDGRDEGGGHEVGTLSRLGFTTENWPLIQR